MWWIRTYYQSVAFPSRGFPQSNWHAQDACTVNNGCVLFVPGPDGTYPFHVSLVWSPPGNNFSPKGYTYWGTIGYAYMEWATVLSGKGCRSTLICFISSVWAYALQDLANNLFFTIPHGDRILSNEFVLMFLASCCWCWFCFRCMGRCCWHVVLFLCFYSRMRIAIDTRSMQNLFQTLSWYTRPIVS